MDRLTYRDGTGEPWYLPSNAKQHCHRLCAYEDSNLTPSEVMELAKANADERLEILQVKRPEIVCLCGSTRFTDVMLVTQWELTKKGCIVLSWCALPDWYFKSEDKAHVGDQEGVKELVDEVHKRKIDLCDRVFVINIDGYIGQSTRSEIEYAEKIGKPIQYLEAAKAALQKSGMD